MQTDLADGVGYLARQGLFDPKRVCIVGASYGGYAVLAGSSGNVAERYWDRYLAVSGAHDPAVRAISPIEHAGDVRVPLLLIHGREDTVVPYSQSDGMAKALKKAGKSVQFVALNHEDHLAVAHGWLGGRATMNCRFRPTESHTRDL